MSSPGIRVEVPFTIGPFQVDPRKNVIERDHHRVHVEPKAMRVHVPKDGILRAVWGGPQRTADVLTNAIWELRKALGDDAREPDFIQTVPKRGYRLVATVGSKPPSTGLAPIARWLRTLVGEQRESHDFLDGQRAALVRVLEAKFGPLPDSVARRIRDLRSSASIDECLDRITSAGSLDELDLAE
jgi:hypothetical protein